MKSRSIPNGCSPVLSTTVRLPAVPKVWQGGAKQPPSTWPALTSEAMVCCTGRFVRSPFGPCSSSHTRHGKPCWMQAVQTPILPPKKSP
eukprot:1764633-Heterocapsa_arctica.AAC.1